MNTAYGGLFNPLTEDVFPAYYAFRAFNELYKRREYVRLVSEDGVYAAGATDGRTAAALLANSGDTPAEVFHRMARPREGTPVARGGREICAAGGGVPRRRAGCPAPSPCSPGAAVLLETL